jgi:hypothetical protein
MNLLIDYNLPSSRMSLLARYTELIGAMDTVTALIMAQAAGQLSATDYRKSANIAAAFRDVVSVIQDFDNSGMTLGELIALARIKRAFRDAALVFPWPYNPAGSGAKVITLTPRADAALTRLSGFDPLRDGVNAGAPRYSGQSGNIGGLLSDMAEVCAGFSFTRSTPEELEMRATVGLVR